LQANANKTPYGSFDLMYGGNVSKWIKFANSLRLRLAMRVSKVNATKAKAEAQRLFGEYLRWGGYPAMANLDDYSREPLLREYFDTMILRDIIQRYGVSKPQQCVSLYRFLLSNISRPHTLKSAYLYLKDCGYATSRDAVRNYIKWAEDSWLLFAVPVLSQSHKEQERNYRKVYSIDWALALHNSTV